MNQLIHRDMTIEEIFKQFPHKSQKLAQEITNSGLHCVGCSAATWETVEAGMMSHGCSDDEIDSLIESSIKIDIGIGAELKPQLRGRSGNLNPELGVDKNTALSG